MIFEVFTAIKIWTVVLWLVRGYQPSEGTHSLCFWGMKIHVTFIFRVGCYKHFGRMHNFHLQGRRLF